MHATSLSRLSQALSWPAMSCRSRCGNLLLVPGTYSCSTDMHKLCIVRGMRVLSACVGLLCPQQVTVHTY